MPNGLRLVRKASDCGKIYSRHLFSYGGLKTDSKFITAKMTLK